MEPAESDRCAWTQKLHQGCALPSRSATRFSSCSTRSSSNRSRSVNGAGASIFVARLGGWLVLAIIIRKRERQPHFRRTQSDQHQRHKSLPFENTHSSLLGSLAGSQRSGDLLVGNPFALVASRPATARPLSARGPWRASDRKAILLFDGPSGNQRSADVSSRRSRRLCRPSAVRVVVLRFVSRIH